MASAPRNPGWRLLSQIERVAGGRAQLPRARQRRFPFQPVAKTLWHRSDRLAALPLHAAVMLDGTSSCLVIFFGMRRVDLAFMEIVLLWLSIVSTVAASTENGAPLCP